MGGVTINTAQLNDDLSAEQRALDEILAPLDADRWSRPTPSARWTVADQVAHLTFFDQAATVAIERPDDFDALVEELLRAALGGDEAMDDHTLGRYRRMAPGDLLEAWRAGREALRRAAGSLDDDDRVKWFGPSMSARSFLTARLMEVWAHGQDVCDAVGASRVPTARLAHIARLGFLTRGWTYVNRGAVAPTTEVRVDLTGPDGQVWSFGPDDADERVAGSAEEFCLVVTQRRHVDDTSLEVTGDDALTWMTQAQAFAGPPTDPPVPST